MDTITRIFPDDGIIPNNRLPVIIYKNAFSDPDAIEETFHANNWRNSWRNGIFPYHHYHSITHEVLGVYRGWAEVQLGGEGGEVFRVESGDAVVLPAGTGHKKKSASEDFEVIGAYPDASDFDLLTGKEGERPKADRNIENVPLPDTDPVFGNQGELRNIWKK